MLVCNVLTYSVCCVFRAECCVAMFYELREHESLLPPMSVKPNHELPSKRTSTGSSCENNIMRIMVVGLNWNLLFYIWRHLYKREGRKSIASQLGVIYSMSKLYTFSFLTSLLYQN